MEHSSQEGSMEISLGFGDQGFGFGALRFSCLRFRVKGLECMVTGLL